MLLLRRAPVLGALVVLLSIAFDAGAQDAPVRRNGDRIELASPIEFEIDDPIIRASSFPLLDALAAFLSAHPEIGMIEIGAHTDPAWRCQYCGRDLERARAEAVLSALLARGVPRDRMRAVGYGDTRPLVRCDPRRLSGRRLRPCRAQNRRIDILVS